MARKPIWSTMETAYGRVSVLIHRREAVRITTEVVTDEGDTVRLEGGRRAEHQLIVNRVPIYGYMYVERVQQADGLWVWDLPRHRNDLMSSKNWGHFNFKRVDAPWHNGDISHSAQQKLYHALLEALAAFYEENPALFDQAEVIELERKIETAERAVKKAADELHAKQEELRQLQETQHIAQRDAKLSARYVANLSVPSS